MARMVSIGAGLQDIYLVDHDDFVATSIGASNFFGKIEVGSKVDIDRLLYRVGGGGVNSAITFARHGHEAVFMGNIGRDSAGSAIVKELNREGVDTSYIQMLGRKTTGTSVVFLDTKSGERTIFTCRGASEQFGNFSEEDLDLIQPDWLYVTTLRGDLDSLERFFVKAREIRAKVMFNPGVRELAKENMDNLTKLLKYVEVLIVNKSEAAKIVPGSLLGELIERLGRYVPIAIITDGSMGGIATDGKETYRFGIYEDVRMRDATGAGDAFGSGFLSAFAAGRSFQKSLVFAAANATSVVTKIGGNLGALDGTEVLHPMPIQRI